MATKQEITEAIRAFVERSEKMASGFSPADWEKTIYEQGWTVKQAYCHLAALGGAVPFFISMATSPQPPAGGGGGGGGGFDIDAWNAQQVAARQDEPVAEILSELKVGYENGIRAVAGLSEELLAKQMDTPFGLSGSLGDLFVQTVTGHNQIHLDDIERALQRG